MNPPAPSRKPRVYVGLNMGMTMFPLDQPYDLKVVPLTKEQFLEILTAPSTISCFNPSHRNTLFELGQRMDTTIPLPELAKRVFLEVGDTVVVVTAVGLKRKTNSYEYTPAELKTTEFKFSAIRRMT